MTRLVRRFTVCSMSAAMMLAAVAGAGMPKALDYVPESAMLVIATPSVSALDADAAQLTGVMGLPEMITVKQALGMAGLRGGVDFDGSAAIILLEGDLDGDEPPMLVLIPTSDYAAFLGNFGGAPGGAGGVDEFELDGRPAFAKKLDAGYAVISPERSLVEGFEGRSGHMKAHQAALGVVGGAIAEKSDLVAVANIQAMGPLLDKMLGHVKEGMANAGAMGGQQADAVAGMQGMMDQFVTTLKRDGRTLAIGLDVGAIGASLDCGLVFMNGSESAKKMNMGGGKSSDLLSSLPGNPFLFASAIDLTSGGVRAIVKDMAAMQKNMPGFGAILAGINVDEAVQNMKGVASAIYPNPAGPMGGLLANTVQFTAATDPKAALQTTRQVFSDAGKAKIEGVSFDCTYTEGAMTIDGLKVDEWSCAFDAADPAAAMQMQNAMTVMYGPGGMGGFMVATDRGVFQTMSKNADLLKEALAARGEDSVAGDATIRQIQERLPAGRTAEVYIGVKPILDMAIPFAQMMGMPVAAPAEVSPVGASLVTGDSAVRGTVFVPADVLKTATSIGLAVQQQMMGGGAPGAGQGGGRPRF